MGHILLSGEKQGNGSSPSRACQTVVTETGLGFGFSKPSVKIFAVSVKIFAAGVKIFAAGVKTFAAGEKTFAACAVIPSRRSVTSTPRLEKNGCPLKVQECRKH